MLQHYIGNIGKGRYAGVTILGNSSDRYVPEDFRSREQLEISIGKHSIYIT